MSQEHLKSLAEQCVIGCSNFLLSRQVIAPYHVASLDQLDREPATRGGDRFIDTDRIVENKKNNRLKKVGVSGDVNLGADEIQKISEARSRLKSNQTLASKVRRYLKGDRPYKYRRIIGYGVGQFLEFAYRRMSQGRASPCTDIEWGHVAGINYFKVSESTYRCRDRGAIYETWLTTQRTPYPSQVGSDLYTNACAAQLFRWMYEHASDKKKWGDAYEELQQYNANFFDSVYQRIEFDHREFVYGPVLQAFGEEAASDFNGWTRYDPVNVFGLRLYNLGLKWKPTLKNKLKLYLIITVMKWNQSKDGLIRDNSRGMCVDSADLTYHQYAMAMLCLGNKRIKNRSIDSIVARAISFSVSQQLLNGEVAYYGRAANNVYHLAAFLAALFYGRFCLKMDVDEALEKSLRRLSELQRDDGAWDTCSNGRPEHEMSGWHGSVAQYSALSAFLLSEAIELIPRKRCESDSLIPVVRQINAVKHCMLKAENTEIALSCGGDRVKWGAGQFEVGYPGITALTFKGENIWLGNEKVYNDIGENIHVADIQDQQRSVKCHFADLGYREAGIDLRDSRGLWKIACYRYKVSRNGYEVFVAGKCAFSYGLALKGNWHAAEATSPGMLELFSDSGLKVIVDSSEAFTFEMLSIEQNTQGKGVLVKLAADVSQIQLRIRFSHRIAKS